MKRFIFAMLLVGYAFGSSALAQSPHPNIVVILADDLGYGDLSYNGCPDYQTPNIDAFASNGILCTNGYVTHPFCSPSRAALLTGRYQQRFGHEENPDGDDANPRLGLPETEITLPQILKPAGYVCGIVGKWHLGVASNLHPLQRGFDEFFGFLGPDSNYYNANLLRNETPIVETSYLTDAFTREGVSFINRHATQPFFLYLAYNAPHTPYDQPPAIYMNRVRNITDPSRQIYAAMVTALDVGVGQVLQALQTNNIVNNTLIFFLSDNGAPPLRSYDSNTPFRGYKMNVLEGGIHIPFAVQWPAQLPSPLVYQKPVSSLDIVPTAAAAAGVSLPTDRIYDGLNMIPYFAQQQLGPDRTLFWRWAGLGSDGPPGSEDTIWAVRSGALKLVTERNTTGQPPALYDLSNDIGESQDLALTRPGDVDTLQQLYAQWNTQTISTLFRTQFASALQPLVLAGDWNGFNISDSHLPWLLTRITAPATLGSGAPDAYNWFTNTIHVAATGGDTTPGLHSFALVAGEKYSTQWGGVTINIDGTTSVPFFAGSGLGPTNSITFEDGFYYSFRLLEWGDQIGSSMNLGVFKTSAPPVSVSVSGQTPQTPTSDDPVVVSITTSQPKSAEELIYLRWSTDFFITSNLVLADGAGTSYSATIAPQPSGTAVQYCVLTSTVDLSSFVTSGIIDSLTLAASDNAKFIVSDTPTITIQPTDTTVRAGQRARFSVTAIGTPPLNYQWTKNGLNITGATKATYRTPPTTAADNGALFAVTVSNLAGSVTSNNAILTVH
jgi:arylsulfatase A-like enzyme